MLTESNKQEKEGIKIGENKKEPLGIKKITLEMQKKCNKNVRE